jgi:transposase
MVTVGIDVSKQRLDVAQLDPGAARPVRWACANDAAAISELCTRLVAAEVTLVALEATGPYHAPLLVALLAAQLPVTLLNPLQIKAFRQTMGQRNKTDRADALLIARFAQLHHASLRRVHPAAPRQRALRDLVRYRADLLTRRTALGNQQAAATLQGQAEIVPFLAADLAQLADRLAAVETRIQTLLEAIPEAAVLRANRGLGWRTVAVVLAELPCALWGDAKAAAAYAGVHPAQVQSGTRQTSRMSKHGNAQLRQALYCAAVPGLRWNATLQTAFNGMVARGKPKMVALGAMMHKLLRIMMGTLRAWYRAHDTTPLALDTADLARAA